MRSSIPIKSRPRKQRRLVCLVRKTVDWKQAMRQRAISARAVFAANPWASALIDSRPSSGPARLRYFDWVIGTLRQAGFSLAMTVRAFSLIDSYIDGFASTLVITGILPLH